MKIIIFGSTGMLGNYVYSILKEKYNVICYTRKEFDIIKSNWIKLKNILNKYQENDNQEDLLELFNKGKCLIDDE